MQNSRGEEMANHTNGLHVKMSIFKFRASEEQEPVEKSTQLFYLLSQAR